MSQVKFCPQCGSPLDAGTRFCPRCGTSIVRANDVAMAGAASTAATASAAMSAEADAAAAMASLDVDDGATVVIPPAGEAAQWYGGAHAVDNAATRQHQRFQGQPTQQIPTQNAYGAPGNQGYQQGGYQQGGYQQPQGGYQQPQGGYQQGGYQAQPTAAYAPAMAVVDSPRQSGGMGKRVVALICAALAIVFLNLPFLSIPDLSALIGSSNLSELASYGIAIKPAYTVPEIVTTLNAVINMANMYGYSSYSSASAIAALNAVRTISTVLLIVWVANIALLVVGALKLFVGKLRRGTFLVVAGVLNMVGAVVWAAGLFVANTAIASEAGYNITVVSVTPWVVATIVACLLAVILGAMCKSRA